MAASTVRKLTVEVVEAHDLMPKDGTGSSSPYVVVDFDGQRRKTQTVLRDLNPTWNEALDFTFTSPGLVDPAAEPVEVDVYHDRRAGPSRRSNFLGRVRLSSRQIVRKGEEALMHFPLEKKSFFGWVRGEIGLKIYYVDEAAPPPATPPAPETKADEPAPPAEQPATEAPPVEAVPDAAAPPPLENESSAEKAAQPEAQLPVPENAATEPPQPNSQDPPPPPSPAPPEPEIEVMTRQFIQTPPLMPSPSRLPEIMDRSKYDLVDKMQYLFVRVVRARSLPGDAKPHVRVAAYGRHVTTRPARQLSTAVFEWHHTFAFARDASSFDASSTLEISVWDLPPGAESGDEKHFFGVISFDVSEVPLRDPPDSPLALQWYRLEGGRGARGGDLMLATWVGTQADESFADAWKADAPASQAGSRSKVYLSPKLWYLRFTVIEAHDVVASPSIPAVSVRATLGFQALRTRSAVGRNGTPTWNEDLLFVAAEPFGEDQSLVMSVETRQGKDTFLLGSAAISLSSVERRVDGRKVASRWLDLTPPSHAAEEGNSAKKGRRQLGGGRLHVRICFDGGYHVSDEPPQAASDFRPSARQLWQPPVGTVEVGIVGCKSLLPMKTVDGKGTTDAFAVAKYGPKWARTRTAADNFDPVWNEQYTWQIYDPCTVLTIAVFDDSDGLKESKSLPMGKIRIRISTLEANRVYRSSYPLLMLLPSGVKRMGEIELAVRFSRAGSALELLHIYRQPMLPAMHHLRPVPAAQREPLRLAAARITAAHLGRSEPPLRREVALWMLDAAEPRGYSMRKVRANWYRIMSALSWISDVARWVEDTRTWRSHTNTMMAHAVLVLLAWYPEMVAPTVAVHVAAVGVWRYRRRQRVPAPHPCLRVSQAEVLEREELDEEFDQVASSRGAEVVRTRYDRIRGVAARFQTMLGDVAAEAERVQALVTWRDPRATGVFVAACFLVGLLLFLMSARIIVVAAGLYYLRHPMFRGRMPAAALNFFRRLPSLNDRII